MTGVEGTIPTPGAAETRVTDALARIVRSRLGALLHVDGEGALAAAAASDARARRGEPSRPLEGIPVAVKDNLATRGLPTTCGSRMLDGWVPPYDAHVVERLRAAGAAIVGKTNLDEFGMGSSTERSSYGVCRNPFDGDRVPGGSSGGSAAAVAAGLVPIALGTDTGGSVRQPAAFCGVYGLRPTWGRVSRRGLVAFASSLDQVGVLARTPQDCARGLRAIAGPDPGDATSVDVPVPDSPEPQATPSVDGLRVGLLRDWVARCDPAVGEGVHAAASSLDAGGAVVRDVAFDAGDEAIGAYYVVASAEASSNLARFDGMRFGRRVAREGFAATVEASRAEGLGPEVVRRILLGTFVLSAGYYDAYYATAMRARAAIRQRFADAFQDVDVVLGPTAPTTAFRLGERLADPLDMYLSDVFTLPPALADLPALSGPVGLDGQGLPRAYQIVGPRFSEGRLLGVAAFLEGRLGPAPTPPGVSP